MCNKILLVTICLTVCFAFLLYTVEAYDEITTGIAWLKSVQNPDGSWDGLPESLTTGFHTTVEVLNIFYHLGMTVEEAYLNGVQWVSSQDVSPFTDCFSRQVKILAESGSDVTGQLNTLLSYQNSDGGWSGYPGDSSEILDTILVLFALSSSSYSDTTVIGGAIDFILSGQNSDGSFGFKPGEGSVYLTSSALLALSSYQYSFNITRNIDNATDWLLSQQNADGSFGTSIFETALDYSALVRTTIAHTQTQQALEYIKSMQLENGSWNNNAFETALALRALADAKPNLTISSGDIMFSPASVYEGYRVRITATVRNSSIVEASNVVVRFYLGLPSDNIQIGTEQVISSIAGGSVGIVEVEWDTTGYAGVNDIYAVVDPDNAIDELKEGDNTRAVSIEVLTLPVELVDVGIAEVNVAPGYPTEGDIVVITGLIANQGQIDLANVDVGFYEDGVDATNQIGSGQTIGMLSAGSSEQVQVEWDTTGKTGVHTIYVVVDPGNKIGEADESDNTISSAITVSGKVELADFGVIGISLSNSLPMVGDEITITAQIENKGLVGGGDILVRFYDGEPGKEGTVIIADRSISSLDSGAVGYAEVTWIATPQGSHKVYVVVDPNNTIPEGNELNNDSYVGIGVGLPDFFISSEDITFSNPTPFPQDIVILTGAVHNLMYSVGDVRIRFYDGNPNTGGIQIGQDQIISLLHAGDITLVSVDWIIPSAGIHSIYVILDPLNIIEEWDETNNIAIRDIVVNAEFSGTISVATDKTVYNAEEDIDIGIDITIDQLAQEFKTWTTKDDWESEGTTRTNIDTKTSSGDVLLVRQDGNTGSSGYYASGSIVLDFDSGSGGTNFKQLIWDKTLFPQQEFISDSGTVLLEHFNNTTTGTNYGYLTSGGRFGQGIYANDGSDKILWPGSPPDSGTVEFWIYLSEDPTQDKNIFTNTNEYDYPYFVIRLLQDRKIWTFYTNGVGRPQFTSLYPIQLNSWNFVSFGYGGGQTNKLWVNGVLAGDGGEIKDLMPGWGGVSVKYGFGRIYGRDDPVPGISNTYIDELRVSNVRRNYHAELKTRIKVADTFEGLNTAEWSSYFMNSPAVLDIPTGRYARIEATLETLEPSIPILHSLTLGYETEDITAEVLIEDAQGNVVHSFIPITVTDYTLGGPKHYDLVWNTGNTIAGDYKAHAILKERGETKAESFAPFTIPAPEAKLGVTSTVAIDKISYNSNQDVSIISKMVSQAINWTYTNLTMREIITSPTNEIISTQEKSIPTLLPEQDITLTFIWNTGKNAPGAYAVTQHLITSTGETVDTKTATFTIESTAETGEGISGTIEAIPAIVNEPTFDIVSTITNQGNVGLRGVILERLIIDPDTKEQVRVFTETIDLAISETRDSIITGIPVQGLSAKDYLLTLNAVIDNKTYPLASGYVKIVIVIATIRIEPETFNKNTGEFTAFVQFQEGFDASTIRDTYCDGAPGVNYNYVPGKNEMIIKFRRDQITEVPLDIHFIVRGIFDSGLIFEGFDDIMKITE